MITPLSSFIYFAPVILYLFFICLAILNISFCCSLLFSPFLQLSPLRFGSLPFCLFCILFTFFLIFFVLYSLPSFVCPFLFLHHPLDCFIPPPCFPLHSSMTRGYTTNFFCSSKISVLSCFHPPLFILFFSSTFKFPYPSISILLSSFLLSGFSLSVGSSHLDLPSIGGVVLNTHILG